MNIRLFYGVFEEFYGLFIEFELIINEFVFFTLRYISINK